MPSFVYVLGCRTPDRTLTYVGWTTDVDRRLAQHNGGTGARTTRGRVWILLHTEKFRTRRQAMSREWYLKRDRKFRKALANGCPPDVTQVRKTAGRASLTDGVRVPA